MSDAHVEREPVAKRFDQLGIMPDDSQLTVKANDKLLCRWTD